jgi:hypothetical protein
MSALLPSDQTVQVLGRCPVRRVPARINLARPEVVTSIPLEANPIPSSWMSESRRKTSNDVLHV